MAADHLSIGQSMKIGEVIITTDPVLKDNIHHDTLEAFIRKNAVSANNKRQRAKYQLFEADRGKRKGSLLMVCSLPRIADRKTLPPGSPFQGDVVSSANSQKASDILADPGHFTEYHLLGARKIKTLPDVAILGIHYLKVKETKATDFEKFVEEKMHPAVANLLPDMRLLTYKAVDGMNQGSYITIFAIESTGARDRYWPEGKPETEQLKQAFRPLGSLALELKDYLVAGSYLEPSGGAAAIFESREWTDYIYKPVSK